MGSPSRIPQSCMRPGLWNAAQSSSDWGPMFAMSVVSLLPVFPVFLFGQKFLLKGVATTGIK